MGPCLTMLLLGLGKRLHSRRGRAGRGAGARLIPAFPCAAPYEELRLNPHRELPRAG